MRKTVEEQEVVEGLCAAPLPGETFSAVGVFPQRVKHLCLSCRGEVQAAHFHQVGRTGEV